MTKRDDVASRRPKTHMQASMAGINTASWPPAESDSLLTEHWKGPRQDVLLRVDISLHDKLMRSSG